MEPNRLRARITMWAEEEARIGNLPSKAGAIFEALLFRGELPRGDAALLGATARDAWRVLSALTERGVLTSGGLRDPVHLAFPAALASRRMPALLPERAV